MGIDPSFGNRYEPTSYKTLKHLLKYARNKGFNSILDIGCGYGRPLIVAKEVGFSNLYGVDISEKLIEICNKNLEKLKIKAQIKRCYAIHYEIPNEDLVIFMFNTLKEERLSLIIDKLKKRKNQYLIIYANPEHPNCFPSKPIYVNINKHYGLFRELQYIYEI